MPGQFVYYPGPGVNTVGPSSLSYQTPHPIPQNISLTTSSTIQSQPQMPVSTSTGAPYNQSPVQELRKVRTPIKIRDPRQGGKDVTAEILKTKKDITSETNTVDVAKQEQIKAEFAAKVAAKAGRSDKVIEQEKSGQEDHIEQIEASSVVRNESAEADSSVSQPSVEQPTVEQPSVEQPSASPSDAATVEQMAAKDAVSAKIETIEESSSTFTPKETESNQSQEGQSVAVVDANVELADSKELHDADKVVDTKVNTSDGTEPVSELSEINKEEAVVPDSCVVLQDDVPKTEPEKKEEKPVLEEEVCPKTEEKTDAVVPLPSEPKDKEETKEPKENHVNSSDVSAEKPLETIPDETVSEASVATESKPADGTSQPDDSVETQMVNDNNNSEVPSSSLVVNSGDTAFSASNSAGQGMLVFFILEYFSMFFLILLTPKKVLEPVNIKTRPECLFSVDGRTFSANSHCFGSLGFLLCLLISNTAQFKCVSCFGLH